MDDNATQNAAPPTREFTAAWIAYALFAIGVFLWWPALIGAIVCHAKRGAPAAQFIDSHYTWLVRTFWGSVLAYVICIGVVVSSVWPMVRDIYAAYQAAGGDWESARLSIQFNWSSIFMTVGMASAGAFGLLVAWFWYVYRVVRGAFRLGSAQPVP